MGKEIVTVVIEDGEVQDVYCDNDNLVVRVIYLDHKKTEVEFRRNDNNKQIN